jgi:hypothetical protein
MEDILPNSKVFLVDIVVYIPFLAGYLTLARYPDPMALSA